MKIDSVNNALIVSRQYATNLQNEISKLDHKDPAVQHYISKLSKMSLQQLDLLNELRRQLGFLNNELKSSDIRKKSSDIRNRRSK